MKDKVVLITGASSGIGRACAEEFARRGALLAISGRSKEALQETKDKCCALGVKADDVLILCGDLCVDADVAAVVDGAIARFGRIDVFINSAGVLVPGSTSGVSLEDYDRQMTINTRSPFLLCKLCLPHLIRVKGNIVNVSSVTGLRAFPGVVAYNMSKAALDQLTRTLALEVAVNGVRVNSVNPGVIVTEVHKRAGMDDEAYQKFLEHSKTTHAMGRVGAASEVASAVAFLASDGASFITGVTLPVDGGRSIMCPR